MILLEPDKMRTRIHMGVPVLGVQDSGFALGYRFSNVMGLLERRMNTLQPHEYARLTGTPTAALALSGTASVGATISATVGALSAFTYTVTSADMVAPDPVLAACTNFANAFNAANGTQFIATQQPSVVFPVTTIGAGPAQWQLAFVSTGTSAFAVSTVSSGGIVSYVVMQGALPKPSVTFSDDSLTCVGYLGICDYLEGKTAQASDLSKFSKADVVSFRPDEMQYREAMYKGWRKRLADFFGIPLYPMPSTGTFGGANTGLTI
jgi:hypothetical protein